VCPKIVILIDVIQVIYYKIYISLETSNFVLSNGIRFMLQNLDYICQNDDLGIHAGLIHRDKQSSYFLSK
jgi:hypothetical protein